MGWSSVAEKLNRVIGGYRPEEEIGGPVQAERKSEIRIEPTIVPPKPIETASSNTGAALINRTGLNSSSNVSFYDAPAITRESLGASDAAVPKPRKKRSPKQKPKEKELAATAST